MFANVIYRRRWSVLTVTTAAVLWATLGQSLAQSRYVPDNAIHLENVRQGEVIEHRFMVRNPGNFPVRASIVNLSHPGMKIRMPREFGAESTGWITVTWDTRTVQGETTVDAELRFNERESVVLSISARVIPPIDVLPYPAVFISGFRDEAVTRTLEVVNNDPTPMNITAVTGEDGQAPRGYRAFFSAIEPGRRYRLDVQVKSAVTGRSDDVLLVLTDHSRFPVIRVPVHLFVKDDVYLNPESVDFGQVGGEVASPETFLLHTRRGPLKILSATSDLPFLSVKSTSPDVKALTHEFRVELDRDAPPGHFSGSILIKTDDPEFPELSAPVEGAVVRR